MRLGASLAGAKFATHSWRCATGWAADSKHLFGSDFFHSRRIAPTNVEGCSILTILSNLKEKVATCGWATFVAFRRCTFLTFRSRMSPSGESCIPTLRLVLRCRNSFESNRYLPFTNEQWVEADPQCRSRRPQNVVMG
jgi:hypothetical protein